MAREIGRRGMLAGITASVAAIPLGGCNPFSDNPTTREVLDSAEGLTEYMQRLILSRHALAQEFREADISPYFKPNGSTNPDDPAYVNLAQSGFSDWRLEVNGLVASPLSLSLSDLRAMPSRTQITRHDCVEGWSCIGKWTGVPLSRVLERARLKPDARYIVFYCADSLDEGLNADKYYESIDLIDAFHPQTILAYDMNGAPLTVPHGAPLRLRAERQLGYKMAKYIMRIEAVQSFQQIAGGSGGYWEDRGYEWYAGI
jgi:DMSO/TMAO reductase YedYZ molybdopterin-dependent catalytic subunit